MKKKWLVLTLLAAFCVTAPAWANNPSKQSEKSEKKSDVAKSSNNKSDKQGKQKPVAKK